ncbi:MAG: hypothetical protein HYV60_18090 [Planctomycetia bacterium]|nr:hypothetical protein [Planctomycetia bacterium]
MSESVITLEDAANRLPELVELVHAQREATVITEEGTWFSGLNEVAT